MTYSLMHSDGAWVLGSLGTKHRFGILKYEQHARTHGGYNLKTTSLWFQGDVISLAIHEMIYEVLLFQ